MTPLASIIGSGFLICGPLLAREFGSAAILAMAALLALAYAVGAVVRFNIVHVENIAPKLSLHDPMAWAMRAAQVMLAIAYAVSVAYYLKLLAEFTMKPLSVPTEWHGLIANIVVTVIIVALTALTFSGEIRKIEHAAHASVSVKLGIIAGLLAGLAVWWATRTGAPLALPPARLTFSGIPLLLGLLITVQGFETSRYMGDSYDQPTRVRTMRYAQWLSSAIYLAFLALLTPFLAEAQHAEGVAGILDIMTMVAPLLGIFVLIGAVSSQLSAAIADSIGSGGLMMEVSRRRLGVRGAFILASALSIAVVWLTDPFSVIALSSRAFALFYAMQAVLALWVSFRSQVGGWPARAGFAAVGLVCIVAALAGAPAES
ncbi:hypothetical protein [Sphingomonas profundi]|uniref:hypothetical protein n=1 Tax=Alterirhizorhabdus profundi TaxID=2681549 RepID=UPI0012E6F737|nr:hypothetical protein [Sphingomonas profundi]